MTKTISLAVDLAIFGADLDDKAPILKILLIRRKNEPFAGKWALPGGFVDPGESLKQAAFRELKEETGIEPQYLEQITAFGEVDRDPRDRVVSVPFIALVRLKEFQPKAGSDAAEAKWFDAHAIESLAFDHIQILSASLAALATKVQDSPIAFELLPKEFTIGALHRLYELILGSGIDRSNFQRRVGDYSFLRSRDFARQHGPHRPARLFTFDRKEYDRVAALGSRTDFRLDLKSRRVEEAKLLVNSPGAKTVDILRKTTGVYFLMDGPEVVYVGQNDNSSVHESIARHLKQKEGGAGLDMTGRPLFDRLIFIPVDREHINLVEGAAIVHFDPKFNVNRPTRKIIRPEALRIVRKYILRDDGGTNG